ncbi:MAG: F0F1 ATP synthase subunit B [Casimicrobiaceae bacterium]|nr:F0F1 ATP synthase subunit B [Casimicrobiaceae bacterium]MCX8099225.1 F0F1 ATP synthase subunit B [Casimicrobiaceae bacterium]MDW8313066.1 F0F1 ATP synthase subunit B [Burkholderiales bacterium]
MNINMTLLLQALGFAIFIFFTVKFVVPPLAAAIEGRRRQIADGLAEAEKGKAALVTAQKEAEKIIAEAKARAAEIAAQAEKERSATIEAAKSEARAAAERERALAAEEIAQLSLKARDELRDRVAELAVAGARRILEREINPQTHAELLAQLKREL